MGEIKSSIEIAMEKTKNLLLSPEEKERLHQEEIVNRVGVIVSRYQEGNLSLKDLENELKSHPEETRDSFSHHLLKAMIQNILITQDNQRIFEAITLLKKGTLDSGIMEKITNLVKENQKILKDGFSSIESLLRERLVHLGIQGDAVIPNTEESQEWHEFQRETRSKHERVLNRLKEKI
jgi:galactokinase